MSPRRSPKRREPAPRPVVSDIVEEWRGEDYVVRPVTGSAATKAYRCPGCDHEIRPATPHIVVYPVDAGADERRHWHSPCWRARDRRRLGR